MKLKKGKHYLLMHPETAKETPLEIRTTTAMNKGEIIVMVADAFKPVQPATSFPELPNFNMGTSLYKGPVIKGDP